VGGVAVACLGSKQVPFAARIVDVQWGSRAGQLWHHDGGRATTAAGWPKLPIPNMRAKLRRHAGTRRPSGCVHHGGTTSLVSKRRIRLSIFVAATFQCTELRGSSSGPQGGVRGVACTTQLGACWLVVALCRAAGGTELARHEAGQEWASSQMVTL
jgi:hypothetical protein